MKQFLASLGLSIAILLAGVVALVVACALGCLLFAWRSSPAPSSVAREAGVSPQTAAQADFDGPPWAVPHDRARREGRRSERDPAAWHSVAAEEFDRAGPTPTHFPAAVLVCRVSMERVAWDQTVTLRHPSGATDTLFTGVAAPDIHATLTVGGDPVRGAIGPEDQHETTLAFPLTTLTTGLTITLRVSDRDLAVNDAAGEASVRYAGHLPIEFVGARFTAACRGVTAERAEALAAPSVRALEALIRRFDLPGYTGLEDLGDGDRRVATIQRDLLSLADWLGWGHPAVRPLVEEADGVKAALPGQIATTLRGLPLGRDTRVGDGTRLRLTAWRCGASARGRCGVGDDQGCVAEFELGRFDPAFPPVVPEDVYLFGPEALLRARHFEALPRSRQHCLAFDARATPTVLAGTAPAVMVFPNGTGQLRVQ